MSINFGGLGSPVKEAEGGTAATTFAQARVNMLLNSSLLAKTLTYNAVAADRNKLIHYTGAGGVDLTLDPAATLTDGWSIYLRNDAAANITINPNGAETINGVATLAVEPGQTVQIFCTGTEFFTGGQAAAIDGANIQLSNLGTTAINTALIPSSASTRDLGTATANWRDSYLQTVLSNKTAASGILMGVWDTGTAAYIPIIGGIVGNPATAYIDGSVLTVTQAPGTNDTKIASTAFVQAAVTAGAGAPTNATYITQTPNAGLSAEQALSLLGTGLVKNTTATGVLSIGVNGTDYYGPGTATPVPVSEGGTGRATSTTAYGTICAGTTATGALQTVSPGTSGLPLVSAGAAALPSYAGLTVPGGGTGRTTLTTAYGTLCAGTTATGAVQTVSPGTSGLPLVSAGAAALPSYAGLTVSGGGTGLTTATTAYGVVCAGTTATGAFQVLSSLGSSGQVLTSNGAGALPSFQANAGGSGGWVLLATVTASASANVDFTTNINSTYDEYRILANNCKNATSGADLQMRISIASTFQTGAFYNYAYGYWSNVGVNATGSATGTFAQMSLTGNGISTSSNRVYGFDFALKAPADTASYKVCQWSLGYSRVTSEISQVCDGISVFTNSASAIDGVRFFNSSGNISSGAFYLYGIKKV